MCTFTVKGKCGREDKEVADWITSKGLVDWAARQMKIVFYLKLKNVHYKKFSL